MLKLAAENGHGLEAFSVTGRTQMKILLSALAAVVALAISSTGSVAQVADDPVGTWRHPANGSLIRTYKCGQRICGKLVKVNDGQKTDLKNKDPSKRNRPVIGMVILTARKTGAHSWAGSIYNRADGNTYAGNVTVKNSSTIVLSGCSLGVFCKNITWSRVH